MKKFIRKYYLMMIVFGVILVTAFFDFSKSVDIVEVTFKNVLQVLTFLPPIFILIGLLDVFVSKETMLKHMGPDSGLMGFVYAFLLGGLAAGPLYMAFPVAAILLKKEAHMRYVVFFIGIWSTLKLPILLYEFANFGFTFTVTNIVLAIVMFLIGAYAFEFLLTNKEKEEVKESAVNMLEQ